MAGPYSITGGSYLLWIYWITIGLIGSTSTKPRSHHDDEPGGGRRRRAAGAADLSTNTSRPSVPSGLALLCFPRGRRHGFDPYCPRPRDASLVIIRY